MRQSKSAGAVALTALLTALSLVILYLSVLVPTGRMGVVAVAGLLPAAAVISGGPAAGGLCYAAASFYRVFGLAGEVPAFILFGLPALIWLPVLFQLGVQGLLASYALLRRALGEGRYPLRYGRRYLARCGVCALALSGCAAVEYFAVPVLLAAVGA